MSYKFNFEYDVKILPYRDHYGGIRKEKITNFVIHHVAGVMTAYNLGKFFEGGSRRVSANIGIGYDGSKGLYVPENMRAYTTADYIDERSITFEVSNSSTGGNWPVSDKSIEAIIETLVYLATKYGMDEVTYNGTKTGTIHTHDMYWNVECPGPYLKSKLGYIAKETTRRLKGEDKPSPAPTPKPEPPLSTLYRVQTGAFKVRENADALEAKLKKEGFDTYIVYTGGLYKVQVGAYAVKANAEAMVKKLEKAGYDTYLVHSGKTPAPAPPKKTATDIAREIWNGQGNWGVDPERSVKLRAAGYNPDEVLAEINRLYY